MVAGSETKPAPLVPPKGSRFGALILVTFIVVGGWFALIGVRERRLTDAVRALPADVQQASYRRAYEDLATVCPGQPALADHCSDEAQFILRFPQCRADCRQLARRYFPLVRR